MPTRNDAIAALDPWFRTVVCTAKGFDCTPVVDCGLTSVTVRVLVQVGLQGLLVMDVTLAPAGRPEALSVTACVAPATRVRVIVVAPESPAVTVIGPPLDRE